jgi:hypothetical protein
MTETHSSRYEIRVQGHLAPRRLDCFEGLAVTHHPDGETSLVGAFRDQSALYGLLNHIFNLGVPLLSVHRLTAHVEGRGLDIPQSGERGTAQGCERDVGIDRRGSAK